MIGMIILCLSLLVCLLAATFNLVDGLLYKRPQSVYISVCLYMATVSAFLTGPLGLFS